MDRSEFVDFLLGSGALTFGDFETKSGRRTPYFIDTGRFRTGRQARILGRAYADEIVATFGRDVDVVFGPTYKGIPLAVACAVSLAEDHGLDVAYCFDRKEVKDHGEGGSLVGHQVADGDRVVIVEDVTTAGTSIRETVPKLRAAARVEVRGLVVAVDRRELAPGDERAALEVVGEEFDLVTTAIVDIDDIVAVLRDRGQLSAADLERIADYRGRYGA